MKKKVSAILAVMLALALMLPVALAAEANIPVPGSDMGLMSDAASTGTSTYTDSQGESHTVYLYPAGTTISGTWLYSAFSCDPDDSYFRYGTPFVLPESGIYELTTMDAMINIQTIYVGVDGGSTAPVNPEPEPEPVGDQPSSWAQEQVSAAINAGLVPDSLQSKYTQTATRAEFCALAVELYETVTGSEITQRATFSDTSDVNVQKMAGIGVIGGVGNNQFNPSGELTREQAATILVRLADALGSPLPEGTASFADNASISSWALEAVGRAKAGGIMDGTGSNRFSPQGAYTREQSIMTAYRLYEAVQ